MSSARVEAPSIEPVMYSSFACIQRLIFVMGLRVYLGNYRTGIGLGRGLGLGLKVFPEGVDLLLN
jgi:hypothetical protein